MGDARYDEFLSPLPEDRQLAVKRWLHSTLTDCGRCGAPILVADSHRLTKGGIVHATCVPTDS